MQESQILLTGRLSLTTPEGVRLLLTPAGPVVRARAWLIDLIVWCIAIFIIAIAVKGSKVGNGILLVLMFISFWGYPIVAEVYFAGRTLGKRIVGIEVVRGDGLPVGWRESSLRNLLLVADFLPAFYATGLLSMLFDQHFRRIGDIVANTQVVYTEKSLKHRAASLATPVALPFTLTPEQQRILIDLFEREANLPRERLLELASLAEPLTGHQKEESLECLRGYVAGLTQ